MGEDVKEFCKMPPFLFACTDDPQTVLMTNPYKITGDMKACLLRQGERLR